MPNISVLMRMIALVFASVMFTLAEASAGPVADELQPPSAPPETAAGDAGAISLTVGGTTRSYLLHVPTLGGALPLVVSIHGRGSNAERHQNVSGLSRLADSEGFIVAYPDALDATWRFAEPGPDEDFILAMIADITRAPFPDVSASNPGRRRVEKTLRNQT